MYVFLLGMVLIGEIVIYKHTLRWGKNKQKIHVLKKWRRALKLVLMRLIEKVRRIHQNWMREAIISTLEFIE